ncbi:MAG: serine hydrolase domain-containing protein, partial [Thermomicrobiales bacterium]
SVRTAFAPITLHHLMTHTAGITSGVDFAPDGRFQVWALRETETSVPPGEYFHHSNVGYKTLSLVLERVAGAPYARVVQERILDPLGLADSVPTITNAVRLRLAVGYGPRDDDRSWWPGQPLVPATWLETDTGDGCLAMTAADLATYLRMLLNRGAFPGGRLISEESWALLTGRTVPLGGDPPDAWYGYGIRTREVGTRTVIGHGGGMVGYFAGMEGDLGSGIGVVALVNGPGSPSLIARTAVGALTAAATGEPFAFPEPDDPTIVANAADFVGVYRDAAGGSVAVQEDNGALFLLDGEDEIPLRAFGADAFIADHPGWNRFPTHFARAIGPDGGTGEVVELAHGPRWFAHERRPAPSAAGMLEAWRAFTGHYRSHNPWTTDFQIIARQGRLWLALPSEPDGFAGEQPLVPRGDGSFRAGDDERIPETVSFDTIVEGKALRARLSFAEYYRVG